MQLYAVNFIPLLSSLYMFWAAHTHHHQEYNCIYSHWYNHTLKYKNYIKSIGMSFAIYPRFQTPFLSTATSDRILCNQCLITSTRPHLRGQHGNYERVKNFPIMECIT
jgi:hypothetical protein